jgi:hypothetical protein
MTNRIYIAGPMTGYKNFNFEAFDEAAAALREKGWLVINPADLDRLHWGFDGYPPEDIVPRLFPTKEAMIRSCIARDIGAIMEFTDGDAIYMLEGWRQSTGANAEFAVFKWLSLTADLKVYTQYNGIPEAPEAE